MVGTEPGWLALRIEKSGWKIPKHLGKTDIKKDIQKCQQMGDGFTADEMQIIVYFQSDLNIFKILKR